MIAKLARRSLVVLHLSASCAQVLSTHVSAGLAQCVNLLNDAVEMERARSSMDDAAFVRPPSHSASASNGPHFPEREGGDWDGAPIHN